MVYIVTDGSGYVKIGVASQLKSRLVAIQTGNPRLIRPIMTFETDSIKNDRKFEKILHNEFRRYRVVLDSGLETEWFNAIVLNVIAKRYFLSRLCKKYDIGFEVKRHEIDEIREIEDRRYENLKSTISSADIYHRATAEEGNLESQKPSARFKVGDVVNTLSFLNEGREYSGFMYSDGMKTERAAIVSIHWWKYGYYYGLDNYMYYSEEMLEPYRQRIVTRNHPCSIA